MICPTFTLMWETTPGKYVSPLYFIFALLCIILQLGRGNPMMAAANSVHSSRFATASTSRPNCPYVDRATTHGQ